MNIKEIRIGIETLQPYYTNPDGYHLNAEHDQIWLSATDKPLPPEEVQKMIDASWWQERTNYDKDFTVEDYKPDEGWTGFV